jgi:hypothetical protein
VRSFPAWRTRAASNLYRKMDLLARPENLPLGQVDSQLANLEYRIRQVSWLERRVT